MTRRVLALASAVVVAVSMLAQAPIAQAAWYDFTTDLPPVVTGRTPFTVNVGDAPVCQMQYAGQTLTAAPWTFTYVPGSSWSRRSQTVDVTMCDGDTDEVWLRSALAFSASPRLSSAEEGPVEVSVANETGEPGTVIIRDPKGRVVAREALPADGVTIRFPAKLRQPLVRYDADVEAGPYRMTFPVDVMRGWSSYFRGNRWEGGESEALGGFAPCAVVTWVYRDRGRPAGTSRERVLADITGALTRLSAQTGLTFRRSGDASMAGMNGVISIGWESMGRNGVGGRGGVNWATSNGTSTRSGYVLLNSQDSWATTNSEAGFGARGSRAGRGWLMVHELMHALGMDHTNDRNQVMYYSNHGQHALGKGDIAGLRYLYPRSGC